MPSQARGESEGKFSTCLLQYTFSSSHFIYLKNQLLKVKAYFMYLFITGTDNLKVLGVYLQNLCSHGVNSVLLYYTFEHNIKKPKHLPLFPLCMNSR